MKHLFFTLFLSFVCVFSIYGQETASPLHDAEIERKVAFMDIEGNYYKDVVVTMKSNEPDYFFVMKGKVKVKVVDSNGKVVYKKTLKNNFLYVFSNGSVEIAREHFVKLCIFKYDGEIYGKIREKEGVF